MDIIDKYIDDPRLFVKIQKIKIVIIFFLFIVAMFVNSEFSNLIFRLFDLI